MPFVLGLTGSIGMGKSTTAQMFAKEGIPVWDADAVVHRLYDKGGVATAAIGAIYPDVITDGAVSRPRLRAKISVDPGVLDVLQSKVHPLVAADRAAFLAAASGPLVLLDIPLLFETGIDALCDGVLVVSAPPQLQRERVLSRGAMSAEDLDLILSRQMPDAEKRARATWVVETLDMDSTRRAVQQIIAQITQRQSDA